MKYKIEICFWLVKYNILRPINIQNKNFAFVYSGMAASFCEIILSSLNICKPSFNVR